MQIHKYLEELWRPLTVANKSIDKYQPWTLMKEGKEEEAMALNGCSLQLFLPKFQLCSTLSCLKYVQKSQKHSTLT